MAGLAEDEPRVKASERSITCRLPRPVCDDLLRSGVASVPLDYRIDSETPFVALQVLAVTADVVGLAVCAPSIRALAASLITYSRREKRDALIVQVGRNVEVKIQLADTTADDERLMLQIASDILDRLANEAD